MISFKFFDKTLNHHRKIRKADPAMDLPVMQPYNFIFFIGFDELEHSSRLIHFTDTIQIGE